MAKIILGSIHSEERTEPWRTSQEPVIHAGDLMVNAARSSFAGELVTVTYRAAVKTKWPDP